MEGSWCGIGTRVRRREHHDDAKGFQIPSQVENHGSLACRLATGALRSQVAEVGWVAGPWFPHANVWQGSANTDLALPHVGASRGRWWRLDVADRLSLIARLGIEEPVLRIRSRLPWRAPALLPAWPRTGRGSVCGGARVCSPSLSPAAQVSRSRVEVFGEDHEGADHESLGWRGPGALARVGAPRRRGRVRGRQRRAHGRAGHLGRRPVPVHAPVRPVRSGGHAGRPAHRRGRATRATTSKRWPCGSARSIASSCRTSAVRGAA